MRILIVSACMIFLAACSANSVEDSVESIVREEAAPPNRQIAFTFDDGPRGDGPVFTGTERTETLIAALADANIENVWFFVTTNGIAREGNNGDARMKNYAKAGHGIANHSHSHKWYNQTETSDYIADMNTAEDILEGYSTHQPYFRFPYLNAAPSLEKRDAMVAALKARGLQNGYVTVDTFDWHMDTLYGEALKAGHNVDMDILRDAYVSSLTKSIEYYDEMAQKYVGRSPKHTLLLHENDMAAMFIDDLARSLRADGWEIISPEEAYQDDIAKYVPNSLYLGNGRVAAIAFDQGGKPEKLRHERENMDFLRAEFLALGLIPKQVDEKVDEK